MKSATECLSCLLTQARNTAKLASDKSGIHSEIEKQIEELLPLLNLNDSPAKISKHVYDIVSEVSGIRDPYQDLKIKTNQMALSLKPELNKLIEASPDLLETALKIAVAGNIIDLGIGHDFDLESDLKDIQHTVFAIDHTELFRSQLKADVNLLYLGDNSGEIVFDGFLIDYLLTQNIDVTYAVKSGPIINDALYEDAVEAGITEKVPVIETGSDYIGVDFEHSSQEFLEIFHNTDIILGKGHGNFESCAGKDFNLFFLLKAKCVVVARELGVEVGDIVFKAQRRGSLL